MFGMSERELIDDLNLAWCVELRDPQPYCPIDLSYEGGEIVISQAEAIERPLRLAADEASALLVALRMLSDVGGGDAAVGGSVIAKLVAAAGGADAAGAHVTVVSAPDAEGRAERLRAALASGRRVHLRDYLPGPDEATERGGDPVRPPALDGPPPPEGRSRKATVGPLFPPCPALSP